VYKYRFIWRVRDDNHLIMSLLYNIPICHRCNRRQKNCNGPCPCTIDGIDIIVHATNHECPLNKFPSVDPNAPAPDPPAIVQSIDVMKVNGPGLWRELHMATANFPAVVESITRQVGCGECRRHWLQLLKDMPPDYSSAEAFFRWAWEIHQAVNRRLGKAGISLEAARSLYAGRPTGLQERAEESPS